MSPSSLDLGNGLNAEDKLLTVQFVTKYRETLFASVIRSKNILVQKKYKSIKHDDLLLTFETNRGWCEGE